MFTIVCYIIHCVGLNIITNPKLKNPPQRLQQVSTINSGYQVHAPITQSGKKYALNNVYVLNKQVSKCVVMAFFSNNTSILSFVLTGYGLCYHACALCIQRSLLDHSTPDYARHGQSCCYMVLKNHIPGSQYFHPVNVVL